MRPLHGMIPGQDENRIPPERRHVMTDEQLITKPAGENRAKRQNEQRDGHHLWRLMDMRHRLGRGAGLAMKRHDQQAPTVERSQKCRCTAHPERIVANPRMRGIGRLENHIL